jgi:hypothetical protein
VSGGCRAVAGVAGLLLDGFEITDDPYVFEQDEYFLNVRAT